MGPGKVRQNIGIACRCSSPGLHRPGGEPGHQYTPGGIIDSSGYHPGGISEHHLMRVSGRDSAAEIQVLIKNAWNQGCKGWNPGNNDKGLIYQETPDISEGEHLSHIITHLSHRRIFNVFNAINFLSSQQQFWHAFCF